MTRQLLMVATFVVGVSVALDLAPAEPPKPYAFTYTAGRAPGHTDRVHSEVSDGSGVVRGMFSYVDPRHKTRTVEYIADKNGFHPLYITEGNQDTVAVAAEKAKHAALYQKIAAEQAQIAYDRGQSGLDDGSYKPHAGELFAPNSAPVVLPKDTVAVHNAKGRHFYLYDKIAEEHARIAAERGPELHSQAVHF